MLLKLVVKKLSKGQLFLKGNFSVLTNLKMLIFAIAYWSRYFSSFFGENWKNWIPFNKSPWLKLHGITSCFEEPRFSLTDNLKDLLRKIGSVFEGFLFRLGHFGFIEVERAPALFLILFKNNAFCSAMFFSRIFS